MNENSSIPLTETTLLILMSLSTSPRHGYAIIKEAESLSDGRVRFSTGTLYGALKRLLDENWIKRVEDPLPVENERERKVYILTEQGRRVLTTEIQRMGKLVAIASKQTEQGAV